MTDTERHLLAAVRAEPGDDLCRLVYADWLEERGDRACDIRQRFIRRQIAGDAAANVPLTVLTDLEPFLGGRQPHQYGSNVSRAGEAEVAYGDLVFTFRRGFLSEVRADLATLIGGDCPRCDGGGVVVGFGEPLRAGGFDQNCPACRGTGRTPGVLAGLVAAHPVEVVRASDREPHENADGTFSWWVAEMAGEPDPADIPGVIWQLFDNRPSHLNAYSRARFATRDDAHAALSAAVLSLARSTPEVPA